MEFTDFESSSKQDDCHVVVELLVAQRNQPFRRVHRVVMDTEAGEIAGIDLTGFSPDGSKAAANYWLAQGDWVEHQVAVYDTISGAVTFRSLEDRIYKRLNRNCDSSYWESIDSVSNRGEIMISLPREGDCVDGGSWSFDPKTNVLKWIRKNSGKKPIE